MELLGNENFDETILRGINGTLVEFYAPWCSHCQHFAPMYEQIGAKLQDRGVQAVKVDITQSRTLASRFSIRRYPTVLYLINGRMYHFEGDRSIESILAFVLNKDYLSIRQVRQQVVFYTWYLVVVCTLTFVDVAKNSSWTQETKKWLQE